MTTPLQEHNIEIGRNMRLWEEKPLLRKVYFDFYRAIARHIRREQNGLTVEIGSGTGNIREVIPACIRTDLFPNPWIDRVENAYKLSFEESSVAAVVLFDVFHHLRYPGTALQEVRRVLLPGGRVIIFEPFISLAGRLIYGMFHHEPIAYSSEIEWQAPPQWDPAGDSYYAAQGNMTRIFFSKTYGDYLRDWRVVVRQPMTAFSYVASGGYSGPQLYPTVFYPLLKRLDNLLNIMPRIFATRALVVLEKI
ncbi:MAG: class I SAM-dependent methyltransferase [Chitinispirillaceae bacterium]|nr:class I SAM-dependent methyltransferase [Chitinispirillaceae bacterium]